MGRDIHLDSLVIIEKFLMDVSIYPTISYNSESKNIISLVIIYMYPSYILC